jgi:hypothetical protein
MKQALPHILRLMGILLVFGGAILGILDVYGIARMPVSGEESLASRLPVLAQAISMVLGMAGLGALMYGFSEWLAAAGSNSSASSEKEIRQSVVELGQSLQRLEAAVSRVSDQQRETANRLANPVTDVAADTVAGGGLGNSEIAHQIVGMLQEIRELAFLSDNQRQQRLADAHQQRKGYLSSEIQRLMSAKDWPATDVALSSFASEYPGDPELNKLQAEVAAAKQSAEENAFGALHDRVEDLMAVWAWDQAYAESARFVENFPDHEPGRELLKRVMSERENYIESTANRLYEEIRLDVDRRFYRRAMANAVKLLECAPGHRKSVAIRSQIKTIRENAEIEERQEQEKRIQELLRNKQFFEAIDLAEDLLQRFPNSPQAETLQTLLPKMRELAIGSEADVQA